MKTERRHELQTNTLAHSLADGVNKVSPYKNHILLALGAVALILLATIIFRGQARAKRAQAWQAFFLATTPSDTAAEDEQSRLRSVIKDFGDTAMAEWATLSIGDENLAMATQLIGTNRSEARKNLNAAVSEYRPLAESSRTPEIRNLATYNLGLCYEMLSQLDKAVEQYRKVSGALSGLAKKRADELEKNTEVKDFYDWFAKAEPKRLVPDGPGIPGKKPAFDAEDPVAPFGDVPSSINDKTELPLQLFPEKKESGDEKSGDLKFPGQTLDSPKTTDPAPADPTKEPAAPTSTEPAAPAATDPAAPESTAPAPATGEAPAPAPAESPAKPETPATPEPAPATEKPATTE